MTTLRFLLAILSLFSLGRVAAQVPDDFNPNASGPVDSMALQADGKILIGGPISTIGGVEHNGIARLNADGALDGAFNPNPDYFVYGMVLQADGKTLVGGNSPPLAG